ncbi:DUF3306 domain-containing protein [Methylobacterium sp. 77]|uniref:DUF3306 domain-containing protein n=1 Tax=Methylobacterium sp. 77 TaxID=1101192 RepID=UPI00035E5341|nr:DUF3306 domain-containing protein [Methylobacterium sp. 77]
MSGGDFLSRWSKRKRALVREAPPASLPTETEAAPLLEELDEAGSLPPEELAKLPSLDSLTAQTDLAQFLRAGVPMMMRKAALRRMWSLDTNIRDYVSEAREYAYDWNVVGGVPGNGPLLPTDDIKAMLRDIFDGTPVAEPEAATEPVTVTSGIGETDEPGEEPVSATTDEETEQVDPEPVLLASQTSGPSLPVSAPRRQPEDAGVPKPRRHGGAVPL